MPFCLLLLRLNCRGECRGEDRDTLQLAGRSPSARLVRNFQELYHIVEKSIHLSNAVGRHCRSFHGTTLGDDLLPIAQVICRGSRRETFRDIRLYRGSQS